MENLLSTPWVVGLGIICIVLLGWCIHVRSTGRPMDHFMLQAATVRDAGRDVVKGARLTDDTWRALCLMCTWLLDEKFCDEHLK